MSDFRDVDPSELRVPPSRRQGADPGQTRLRNADPRRGHRQTSQGIRRRAHDRRSAAMSDTQREALAVLAEIWALSPEVRLGQLMAHLGFLGEVHLGKGLGYIEDDELIAVLYRHRAELQARSEG